jgi:hypothetical protein
MALNEFSLADDHGQIEITPYNLAGPNIRKIAKRTQVAVTPRMPGDMQAFVLPDERIAVSTDNISNQ